MLLCAALCLQLLSVPGIHRSLTALPVVAVYGRQLPGAVSECPAELADGRPNGFHLVGPADPGRKAYLLLADRAFDRATDGQLACVRGERGAGQGAGGRSSGKGQQGAGAREVRELG